jgi:hypothetical protein
MGHIGNWSERKRQLEAMRANARARAWSPVGLLEARGAAFATCTGCRRVVRLDLPRLARTPLAKRDLRLTESRLRCSDCGSKGAVVGVVRPEDGEDGLRLVAARTA